MAGKYKINRSNYVVKSRHQITSGGVVYERDFMTTTNLGAWDSGSIPYGEGNFRMLYRKTENARKRPRPGFWLEHDGKCGNTANTEYWTYGCIGKSGVTEEKSIKIKPNYNSFLDFAYYGSCQELLKSTVRKIISEFPGELNARPGETYDINGTEYIIVENPFGIDVFGDGDAEGIKDFPESYLRYRIISGGENAISSCTITRNENACEHGDISAEIEITAEDGNSVTIYRIIYDSGAFLFTDKTAGFEIRPDEKSVDAFFENLDDFGNLLLNRGSYPKYTATIDWPHDTERGVMTYRRSFTWPMDGDWNLDITSKNYENYLDELLTVAAFYDDGYTDNLWRMLTHDSVKSMDLAFSNPGKDEDQEDYDYGATKLEGLIWAYGRQFDELKRSIDNIKFTCNVSYDENNNIPDYFLSDTLGLSGWEVYNVNKGIDGGSSEVWWGSMRDNGVEKTYTSDDANSLFMRELKLNSKYILKKKGTRDGIVSLLGLFGMVYGKDYEMHESVAVVNGQIEKKGVDEQFNMERLNSLKASYPTSTEFEGFDTFEGIPFTYVINGDEKYIIPWFDKDASYDGGMYFQMNGGWEKDATGKYGETLKYLVVVDRKSDMYVLPASKVYEGAVCYSENENEYYELTDVEKYDVEAGWTQINRSSEKVEYLERIIDDYHGNNPHVGYGKYDDGKEYIERIRVPFGYHVSADTENNRMFNDAAYDCDGNYDEGFKNTKVSITDGVVDDKKAWFFGKWIDGKTSSRRTGVCPGEECENPDTSEITVPGNPVDGDITYDIFDFETEESGKTATESAANSIINTKNLSFIFYTQSRFFSEFSVYLKESVFPYLRQMLPSSTLWKYEIRATDAIPVENADVVDSPITLVVDAIAYGGSGDTIENDFIANYAENHNLRGTTENVYTAKKNKRKEKTK